MRRYRQLLSPLALLLVAALLSVFFVSCTPQNNPTPEESEISVNDSSVGSSEVSSQPEAPKGNLNPLTGHYDLADQAVGKRPVAFMINNIKVALPQYGIGEADIIFEALAEGGITRLMAVFSDYQDLPTQVGPIRSARDYYLDFAAPLDAIFVNWGTSSIASQVIREREIDNIDGMYYFNYFYTDTAIAAQKGYEHSRFMQPDGLKKAMDRKSQRTERNTTKTAFSFRESGNDFTPADQGVTHISVKYSYSYDATFDYDEASGKYLVSEFGNPHMDNATKTQLAFDNVIVIYTSVQRIGTNDGKVAVGLETGEGLYVSRGGGMRITWQKGDYRNRFSFKDVNGNEVALNAGTTYVCIIPLEQQNNTYIENNKTTDLPDAQG